MNLHNALRLIPNIPYNWDSRALSGEAIFRSRTIEEERRKYESSSISDSSTWRLVSTPSHISLEWIHLLKPYQKRMIGVWALIAYLLRKHGDVRKSLIT